MQIAIYLTVRKSGIIKISRALELASLPFEELDDDAVVAGMHVGFQDLDWRFDKLGSDFTAVPLLWLTEAAHAALRPILDPSFFCNVQDLAGEKFYAVTQDWVSRITETFRPGKGRHSNTNLNVVQKDSPHLPHGNILPSGVLHKNTGEIPSEDAHHAFDFLISAPKQVRETPVGSAGFSNRVKGVFASQGVAKVGDLIGINTLEMLSWDNFGRTSLQNVLNTLHALMRAVGNPGECHADASPSNWIESLEATHPDLSQTLRNAEIQTDSAYVAKENSIESFQERVRLAELRFAFLTSGRDVREDPGLVARACPPWVLARNIEDLTIPNSCSKKLLDNGIRTVADLTAIRPEAMLRWPAVGLTTLRDVCTWLIRSIQDGPSDLESLRLHFAGGLVKQWITEGFQELRTIDEAVLPERAVEALIGRSAGKTLQQVGDEMDPPCTRERARQLEAMALDAFKKRAFWTKILVEKFDHIFATTLAPVPVPALPTLDPAFAGVSELGDKFYWVLQHVLPSPVFSISCADFQTEILARISLKEWRRAVDFALGLLRDSVRKKEERTESDLQSAIYSLLPETAAELREHLWKEVSRRAIFVELDGIRRLRNFGSGNEIVELLESSDSPLHWTEIMEVVKHMSRASLLSRLMDLEDVFRFGPGTYGVQKHFRLSRQDMQFLAAECSSIAQGGLARQWSCSEFCEELHRADFHLEGRDEPLTPDIINNALRLHGAALGFVNRGRLNWSLGGEAGAEARLQILPECLEILKVHGRPMLVDDLRRRLVQTRGLGAFLQLTTFHKDGLTMIRMDAQHVGILELHAGPLAQIAGREQLLQSVTEALESQQKGLHISKLVSVENAAALIQDSGLDPILLVDVCRLSEHIRFSRGAYLYLTEWGGDRRHTLAQAIDLAFEGVSGGLTNQQLLDKMENLLGRVVSRSEVLSAVYKTDVRRDESNTVWIRKSWTDEA